MICWISYFNFRRKRWRVIRRGKLCCISPLSPKGEIRLCHFPFCNGNPVFSFSEGLWLLLFVCFSPYHVHLWLETGSEGDCWVHRWLVEGSWRWFSGTRVAWGVFALVAYFCCSDASCQTGFLRTTQNQPGNLIREDHGVSPCGASTSCHALKTALDFSLLQQLVEAEGLVLPFPFSDFEVYCAAVPTQISPSHQYTVLCAIFHFKFFWPWGCFPCGWSGFEPLETTGQASDFRRLLCQRLGLYTDKTLFQGLKAGIAEKLLIAQCVHTWFLYIYFLFFLWSMCKLVL